MFWKKKTTLDVSLEPRFNDHRAAYRIAPEKGKPVIVSVDGNSFHALNVSGTGIAFRAHDFEAGDQLRGMLRLPSENRVFPVRMEVVARQKDLCRCRFTEIHEDAENLLHSYILDLQKRKIRQNSGTH